ncbi:MAG: hypothetical protein WKF77_03470 [Planctomycetaceae bacterium]
MLRSVSILAASLILTSAAFAHEGHGHPQHQHGATHYVVNPSHAVPIVLTVAAVSGVGLLIRRHVRGWRA